MKSEVDRLSNDPHAIEAAARERLGMVNPKRSKEIVGVLSKQDEDSLSLPSGVSNESRLTIYLLLGLFYGGAAFGGFIAVKSLVALSWLIARRRPFHRHAASSPFENKPRLRPPLSTAPGFLFLLISGVMIAGGFVFAGNKRFSAISVNKLTADLRSERNNLLEEQRRLLLSREVAISPARLERQARELGMRARIDAEEGPRIVTVSGSANVQPSGVNIKDALPAMSKTMFLLLVILGGTLSFMFSLGPSFSSLLSTLGSNSRRIESAPGSRYLLFVDFFFSPKDVEYTFKPIVADWRMEYFDALNLERNWKAQWISIRYSYRFIAAMGLNRFLSFIKTVTRVRG